MFENTLALYEWYRSRVAQIERRLARCAAMVIDTGYKEGLETQRTRAVRRLVLLEETMVQEMRAARPPLEDDEEEVPDVNEPPHDPPDTPLSIPARLTSWLKLHVR